MTPTSLALVLLLVADAGARAPQEDCDAIYEGRCRERDYGRALACFRTSQNWLMVAIMQLNGDGMPVDVAAARASLRRARSREKKGLGREWDDGDLDRLDEVLTAREKNPKSTAKRVDYCGQVYDGTQSALERCIAKDLEGKVCDQTARLKNVRDRLEAAARAPFDQMIAAFAPFVAAERERAYQEFIDGSSRSQWAMGQEERLRANLDGIVKVLAGDIAASPTAPRPLGDADKELNVAYREKVNSYESNLVRDIERTLKELRKQSHATQRVWIRYREAAAKLAAVRWPKVPGIEDAARALVTEDRIRELKATLEDE